MTHPIPTTAWSNALKAESDLRAIYKQPSAGASAKSLATLDVHSRRFIELSPFACLGTTGPNGLGDVTPRGGEPGFVHVLSSTHLAMPDRPGNNRLDSLTNILKQPGVGLLFFVPGFEDTLRVNGVAQITTDPVLMQRFVANGKLPISVIVIEVREVYLHCAKALRRAGLWRLESQIPRGSFPTAGQIYRDQLALEKDAAAIDQALEKDARERLY
jgi:PPOX class probable FMN-dependent enzyme